MAAKAERQRFDGNIIARSDDYPVRPIKNAGSFVRARIRLEAIVIVGKPSRLPKTIATFLAFQRAIDARADMVSHSTIPTLRRALTGLRAARCKAGP